MNILQVNNFHYPKGGSDRYFLEISDMLRTHGHSVRTFASRSDHDQSTEYLAAPLVHGVNTASAISPRNIYNFLFSSEARGAMVRALVTQRPDIAHLHIYYGQLTASILKPLREAGIPIVQTLHEYKLVCPTHGLYSNGHFCDRCNGKHYWHALLEQCNRGSMARTALSVVEAYVSDALGAKSTVDRYVAVSEYQKGQLLRLGLEEDKLSVLYHFAEPHTSLPSHHGDYFLYAGRVLEDKGIGVLLEAYAKLLPSAPMLKVAGSGDEMHRWREYADGLGLSGRVEWLGLVTGDALNELFANCLALINPSLLNETFGLSSLEALAYGRPVIASDVGAFSEVVSHGVDGYIVEPGSADALASAMELLCDDMSSAHEMGCRGWEKVGREFSRQRHYDGLMSIYEQMTKRI